MAKEKAVKTNAMRILDSLKISYEMQSYECDEFVDGVTTADTHEREVLCGSRYSYPNTRRASGQTEVYYGTQLKQVRNPRTAAWRGS